MKLHLGCWNRFIPGFIHIDLCDYDHIDYKRNIGDLSIFKNDSVSLIYSSHNLEYFDSERANIVLKEWNRVLKQNGILRIAVPDFDSLIKVYNQTKNIKDILGPLYGKMEIITNAEKKIKKTLYHKTAYTFQSLKEILEKNGFKNIKKYKWQETIHKDYDDHSQAYFPHMDKKNGTLVSLNVEAEKI